MFLGSSGYKVIKHVMKALLEDDIYLSYSQPSIWDRGKKNEYEWVLFAQRSSENGFDSKMMEGVINYPVRCDVY